jgi:hypothetical protein
MFFLLPTPFFGQQSPVREIPFRSVPDFLKLPTDLYLGEVSGVAVNSKGHVFVFSRSGTTGLAYPATAAQLLEFGPDGEFIREIGHNFYAWSFARTVKIDKQDNIWVTDKGSDMVIKFNPHVTPWHGGVCSDRRSRDGDECHGPHRCRYCDAVPAPGVGFCARSHRSEKSTSQTTSQRADGTVKTAVSD